LIETAPDQTKTDSRWRSFRAGWATAAVAFIAFAIVALANMQTGLHGDPRTINPNPGVASYPPFLGVTDWPLVTSIMSAVLTVAFFGYLGWQSIRLRIPHWLLIVGIAAFFAGALDPLANWATFAVFDSRVAHFPLSWPYFNISPLLEPTLSFLGGYASYYVLTGLGLLSLHRRFIEPRIRHNSWLDRHRLVAVFITGFIAGLPLNALVQFMWLKVGLFVYTEAAGPLLHLGGRHLPVYMVIYDSVLFAIVAVLCVRDDNGRPAIVARLAGRLPALGERISTSRLLAVATAVLMSAVLLPIAVFSLLRVSGDPKPAYDVWPYPAVNVYDPYGDLERAGKPGPFYR
jgi:Spirocyclase AveC-like